MWLNNFGGNGTFLARYCALVVGWINVPTLSTAAILPALNTGSSGANAGASAYWMPPASGVAGVNAVAARSARGMAMVLRSAL